MLTQRLITLAALMAVAATPVLAQAVDRTGTGGDPASTAKAPHTARTGQTVPNPGALGSNESDSIERRNLNEARDDAITQGICIGCSR